MIQPDNRTEEADVSTEVPIKVTQQNRRRRRRRLSHLAAQPINQTDQTRAKDSH